MLGAALVALAGAHVARAGDWLPHPADATWTYSWSDTVYLKAPIKEKTTVGDQKGSSFTLHWTTTGLDNPVDTITSTGDVQFQDTPAGVLNTNWSSTPPPPASPPLSPTCACNTPLRSPWYSLIGGGGTPVLPEPLLQSAEWTSSGGAQGDVASSSRYAGREQVTVP